MPSYLNRTRHALLITCLSGVCLCGTAHAQNQADGEPDEGDRAEQRERGNNNDNNNRRSRWQFPDGATSENDRRLKSILDRFPDSDTDKDGVLDAAEARKLIQDQFDRRRDRNDRNNRRRARLEPTFNDVKYGPEDKHHFDLYRAQADGPTPLVVFFHGGQFITGDESSFRPFDIRPLLAAGVSVASIDYRDTNAAPFPGPFEDAEMAIQFIRFYAEQLGIDPTRVGGMGDEAGGNLVLYLALQDDQSDEAVSEQLTDGAIEDPRDALPDGPIQLTENDERDGRAANDEDQAESRDERGELDDDQAREQAAESLDDILLEDLIPWDTQAIRSASTKLGPSVALHPIATFDPRAWAEHRVPMNDHERMMTKYLDVRYLEPLNDAEIIDVVERVSPLALISPDDPALLLVSFYEDLPLTDDTIWTIMRHHPKQSQLIGQAIRAKGGDAIVRYKGMQNDPDIRSTQFLIDRLK